MHETHGRESPEETPNLTFCPCLGHALQKECAEAGCGYCHNAENPPPPLDPEISAALGWDVDAVYGKKD